MYVWVTERVIFTVLLYLNETRDVCIQLNWSTAPRLSANMSSSKSPKDDKKMPKILTISSKCLALILRESRRRDKSGGTGDGAKNGEPGEKSTKREADGYKIFQNFQTENIACFWNSSLVESATYCEYVGFMLPCILLIKGSEYHLEGLRNAWARRILKPPNNYTIKNLGDVNEIQAQLIPQAQFISLPETLCMVISKLNKRQENATLEIIRHKLQRIYSDIIVPNDEILYNALGNLIKERKIYHTGDGYFIMTPESYRLNSTTTPSSPERPILMTNEEALQLLLQRNTDVASSPTHSANKPAQPSSPNLTIPVSITATSPAESDPKLERSQSLRGRVDKEEDNLTRSNSLKYNGERSKDVNLKTNNCFPNMDKSEKESLFSKLFRRSKRPPVPLSGKEYATFSAQFPPVEWNNTNSYSNSPIKSPVTLKDVDSSPSKILINGSKEKRSYNKSSDSHRHGSHERRSSKSPKSGNSPRKSNHSPLATSNESSPRKGDSSPSNGSTKTSSSSPHGSDTPRKESFKDSPMHSSVTSSPSGKLFVRSLKRPTSMVQESCRNNGDQENENYSYKEMYCTSFCSGDISKSYPPPHLSPNHNLDNPSQENGVNLIGLLDSLNSNSDQLKPDILQEDVKKKSSTLSKKRDHPHRLSSSIKVNGTTSKSNSPVHKAQSKLLEKDKNRDSPQKQVGKKYNHHRPRPNSVGNSPATLSTTSKLPDSSQNGTIEEQCESKTKKETNKKNSAHEMKISNLDGSVAKNLNVKTHSRQDSKTRVKTDLVEKEQSKSETKSESPSKLSLENNPLPTESNVCKA